MSVFYQLVPEAAGQLGNKTIHGDLRQRPPIITRPDFEFQFWPHDDLLCGFYVFACSRTLAQALETAHLTGFTLDKLEISFEERFYQWAELHKTEQFPEFLWLQIKGVAGTDDFGLVQEPCEMPLVVSERALNVLKQFKMDYCAIDNYRLPMSGVKLDSPQKQQSTQGL